MTFSWRLDPIVLPPRTVGSPGAAPGGNTSSATAGAAGPGIKEDIDPKFRERYEKWKAEFLSTAAGRRDWERFADDPNFTLTIRMSEATENAIPTPDAKYAAQRGGLASEAYRWEDDRLVAATVFLGSKLADGLPDDKENYPILSTTHLKGDELAAAKIAHELGHVKRTLSLTPNLARAYQKEQDTGDKLAAAWQHCKPDATDETFLRLDKELKELTKVTGDRRERDHWAEANVIPFVEEKRGDKMSKEERKAIEDYRKRYPGR